ncbi:MAG: response regulator transcription factor [Chloroflexi bacterium]|nr:response regulator transcription factor [Chloroflexota bacterium]
MNFNSKPKARILIAEDESALRNLLEMSLSAEGYEIIAAEDGREALELFKRDHDLDMVVLDIMMPRMDGFEVLEEIRKVSDIPVVMLTALGSADDIIKGFNMGADDYITKPFVFREVAARIEAILRRVAWMKQPPAAPTELDEGQIKMNLRTHEVIVRGAPCQLSPIEYNLLKYLMSHKGETVDKKQLFREVWGYEFEGSTNLVEVAVRRLREKIEMNPSEPEHLHTVRGAGYIFEYRPAS